MNHQYDCLVIGAGLAGSVAARELAERGGKRVLVLERRNHVGGNAYDCFDEAGVLIHQYGPHIFHTNSTRVFDYLSRFTRWRPYEHQVVSNLPDGDGRLEYPVPFNLVSLRAAFPPEKARALAEKLVSAYGMEKKVTILELRQNPDPELSALAEPSAEDAPWDDTPLRAVLSLPRKYREVVLLRYYEEFTLEEIADTLGIAPGTVSARLTRAKRKLRPMLEEWYYD